MFGENTEHVKQIKAYCMYMIILVLRPITLPGTCSTLFRNTHYSMAINSF